MQTETGTKFETVYTYYRSFKKTFLILNHIVGIQYNAARKKKIKDNNNPKNT